MNSPFVCPCCQQSDCLKKVSIIYQYGKSHGNFSGPSTEYTRRQDGSYGVSTGYTSLSGQSQTEISQRLEPPKEPRMPFPFLERSVGVLVMIPLFFCGCLSTLCISASLFQSVLFNGTVDPMSIVLLAASAVFGILMVIASVWLGFFLHKKEKQKREQQRPLYEQEYYAWKRAMFRWNSAMLCERDGTLFDPETGVTGSLDHFMSFLYA